MQYIMNNFRYFYRVQLKDFKSKTTGPVLRIGALLCKQLPDTVPLRFDNPSFPVKLFFVFTK